MSRGWKLAIVVAVIAALLAAAYFLDLKGWIRAALNWIDALGPWAPPVFVIIYIVATVLLLPAWPLTLGGGALFGLGFGSLYVSIGSTLGATCAFLLGRSLARDVIAKRLEQNPKLQALDDAIAREGWKIVGLVRLSPVFPYSLMNYAFGLTRVPLRDYMLASWVGMMPATIMYVYFGSLAKDLAEVGTGQRERTTGEWILYGAGLVATVIVTFYLTRMAQRSLSAAIGKP